MFRCLRVGVLLQYSSSSLVTFSYPSANWVHTNMGTQSLNAKKNLFIFFLLLTLLYSSCDNSINPQAPFQPQMVVFSVLSTQTDTQFVRIHKTYTTADNADRSTVEDAIVRITDGTSTFSFRDTVIIRYVDGRTTSKTHLFVAYPMSVEPQKTYLMTISSPAYGTAKASTTTPARGTISIGSVNVLDDPENHAFQDVRANFIISPQAKGYLFRFYLVFTAENPWESEVERSKEKYIEVPLRRSALDRNLDLCDIFYPQFLSYRNVKPQRPGQDPLELGLIYPFPTYNETIALIRRYNFNVRFKRAVFYLVQFDEAFTKYYLNANQFRDKLAVRLGEPPDYSNINGAVGLFGSIRVDSSVWRLPEFLKPFRDDWPQPITYCQQEAPQAAPKFDPLSWMRP